MKFKEKQPCKVLTTFEAPAPTLERLRAVATRDERSVSAVIRIAIHKYLESQAA